MLADCIDRLPGAEMCSTVWRVATRLRCTLHSLDFGHLGKALLLRFWNTNQIWINSIPIIFVPGTRIPDGHRRTCSVLG